MPADRRQKVLLVVLVTLLAFLAWRQLDGRLGGSAGGRSRGAALGESSNGDAIQVVDLRIGDLEHLRGSYEPGRDPFRFGQAPPPDRPAPKPPARRPPPAERDPSAALPPTPAGPRLPAIDLVYLGNFGPADRPIAVFSDGTEIINARIGDVLQGTFEVVQIGYESADLGYIDFPDSPPARLAVGG